MKISNFAAAAASYFGLPVDQVMGDSTVRADVDDEGVIEVVFVVRPTFEDLAGIAARAKELQAEQEAAKEAAKALVPKVWDDAALREEYNNLSETARSSYGSFHRFRQSYGVADAYTKEHPSPPVVEAGKVWRGMDEGQRQIYGTFEEFLAVYTRAQQFVDEPPKVPTVVWLKQEEATEQQKALAVGLDSIRGLVGVDPGDLTPEQRAERGL